VVKAAFGGRFEPKCTYWGGDLYIFAVLIWPVCTNAGAELYNFGIAGVLTGCLRMGGVNVRMKAVTFG
jgi:hypothetical protein